MTWGDTSTGRLMVRVHPGEQIFDEVEVVRLAVTVGRPAGVWAVVLLAQQPRRRDSTRKHFLYLLCQWFGYKSVWSGSVTLPRTECCGVHPDHLRHVALADSGDFPPDFSDAVTPRPCGASDRFECFGHTSTLLHAEGACIEAHSHHVYWIMRVKSRCAITAYVTSCSIDLTEDTVYVIELHECDSLPSETGSVMPVMQVLEKARNLVEEGWCKYRLTDSEGNYCLKAAIGLAAGTYVKTDFGVGFQRDHLSGLTLGQLRDDVAATRVLQEFLPEGFNSIPVFNDDPQTTQGDVLAVVDKAIASLR